MIQNVVGSGSFKSYGYISTLHPFLTCIDNDLVSHSSLASRLSLELIMRIAQGMCRMGLDIRATIHDMTQFIRSGTAKVSVLETSGAETLQATGCVFRCNDFVVGYEYSHEPALHALTNRRSASVLPVAGERH